jgi:hypothetical protein
LESQFAIIKLGNQKNLGLFKQFRKTPLNVLFASPEASMKKQVGQCVHCLKDHVELTSDHVFPQAWYPDAAPASLEKWQFPACDECNNRYSRIERDLLNRFALALDTKHPASADVALRDLEASRDALSRNRYQPQPTERRLSCSRPSDISNWRKS